MTIVLAAVDARPSAKPVLRTAAAIAALFEARVVALHVRENGIAGAEKAASAACTELRVLRGTPVDQIIAVAENREVAALVLGARGARGGPEPAGHTALEVITHVPKPVVVVPPHARPAEELARILVPLDGSPESSRALDTTIELAHRQRLEILVLHIYTPTTVPAFADHEPHATSAWDQEFLRRHIATPHERVTLLHRLGVPADDITNVAHESGADIVVLAWSQKLVKGRAEVVCEMLARSSIPVLLLPVFARHRDTQRSRATSYIATQGFSA